MRYRLSVPGDSQGLSDSLLRPEALWTRAEFFCRHSKVPKSSGVYAWYFRGLDNIVPCSPCVRHGEFSLLYVGISPSAPPKNGASSQSVRSRLRQHFRGNAEASTLRLTLGCLLADQLGLELRRVGSGRGFTFSTGEQRLSQWLEENARVVWRCCDEPWIFEEELISVLDLPLNLDQNRRHAFHSELSRIRRDAKTRARELPVLPR